MRILYVSPEAPFLPAGGIGTYLGYMAAAMAAAGHEVFLLTWPPDAVAATVEDTAPFARDRVFFARPPAETDGDPDWAAATALAPRILQLVEELDIDVIEAADYRASACVAYQRLQSRTRPRQTLCVTYNHGFIHDFFEADQFHMPRWSQDRLLSERQQCRISDLVIAPSRAAAARLRDYQIETPVRVVREPFRFDRAAPFEGPARELCYLGRISISKGIDRLVFFANQMTPVWRPERIRLIGGLVETPFAVGDMADYVHTRLAPELRARTVLHGLLPRADGLALLSAGGVAPHFSGADTFSYACVESIDRGLAPVTLAGSPMAEFFPEDLRDRLFDPQFRNIAEERRRFERLLADGPAVVRALQERNRAELAPERAAEAMGAAYAAALEAKRGVMRRRGAAPRPSSADVTVLIPYAEPGAGLAETADSLAVQTAGEPAVLICVDGAAAEAEPALDAARIRLGRCQTAAQPLGGAAAARNLLIARCETRFALFLEPGDALEPTALARLLEAYAAAPRPVAAALPGRRAFDQGREAAGPVLLGDHLHWTRNDLTLTALIETDAARAIGFDATRRNGEDASWAFWLDFHLSGRRAAFAPEPLHRVRRRARDPDLGATQGARAGTLAMLRRLVFERAETDPALAKALIRALIAERQT